jgi:hypothetical protein
MWSCNSTFMALTSSHLVLPSIASFFFFFLLSSSPSTFSWPFPFLSSYLLSFSSNQQRFAFSVRNSERGENAFISLSTSAILAPGVLWCRLLHNLPSVQRVSTPLCLMWRAYAAPLQRGTWNSIPVQFTCACAVSLPFRLVSGDEALHHCVCLVAGFGNLWIAWGTVAPRRDLKTTHFSFCVRSF